jgi:hypothetical protein
MNSKKRKLNHVFDTTPMRKCEATGCDEEGLFKAPKSRQNIHDYQYFCLSHVQEFNKKWNYFADMPMEAIEDFMQDAVTGHRPTWKREDILSGGMYMAHERLEADLERFLRGAYQKKTKPKDSRNQKEREALALLTLEAACDLSTLKVAYRKLVKQFHPDLHQGSKSYEEKFKQITQAYYYLKELYKEK